MNQQIENCIKKRKNNHSILNSVEISQGVDNTDSGFSKKESNICRDTITMYLKL